MKQKYLLLVLLLILPTTLSAINGILFYGIGPRNRAMGGANGAYPVDTSTLMINPAGIGYLGNTADLGAHALNAKRSMDPKGATGAFVNVEAGRQDSKQRCYVTPFSGISYREECSDWAFGGMIAGVAGEGAQYRLPRTKPDLLLEPNLTTTVAETMDYYDTSSFILLLKAIAGTSYDWNCNLSFGAGLHINALMVSADLVVSKPEGLLQTKGNGRLAIAYGAGFSVGAIYRVMPSLSLGFCVTSPQWFEHLHRYNDLLPDPRLPPEVRVGSAYRILDSLLVTLDYKWIGWEVIDLFDHTPSEGGFGWKDQHTFGAGLEYDFTRCLIGRLGFNYGKSPIRENVLFANALTPAIYESHLAGGLEIKIGEHNAIAFSGVYTFPKEMKDNGKGDLFSQVGKGMKIWYEGIDGDIAWTVRF